MRPIVEPRLRMGSIIFRVFIVASLHMSILLSLCDEIRHLLSPFSLDLGILEVHPFIIFPDSDDDHLDSNQELHFKSATSNLQVNRDANVYNYNPPSGQQLWDLLPFDIRPIDDVHNDVAAKSHITPFIHLLWLSYASIHLYWSYIDQGISTRMVGTAGAAWWVFLSRNDIVKSISLSSF